jgi:hypothetical protein
VGSVPQCTMSPQEREAARVRARVRARIRELIAICARLRAEALAEGSAPSAILQYVTTEMELHDAVNEFVALLRSEATRDATVVEVTHVVRDGVEAALGASPVAERYFTTKAVRWASKTSASAIPSAANLP